MAATVFAIAVTGMLMARMIDTGYEITQMRNAFIASPGVETDFLWTPSGPPDGFLRDSGPPPAEFEQAVATLFPPSRESSDMARALALARHLSGGSGPGGGIKSNTRDAYRIILTDRGGYCSDYTQVMNGLAYAAGVSIREWGLSFDSYSGDGHGFSEIYDHDLKKWVFLDSFYSFYVVDSQSDEPLSVLELRERLAAGAGPDELEVRMIRPERFGFKSPEQALDYYRKGSEEYFLYFGTNVFSYDAHPIIALLGRVSRALEESAGILLGIRPQIRLVVTESNGTSIENLRVRRNLFVALAALAGVLALVLVYQFAALRRSQDPTAVVSR
jgi:hypothetical protein